MDKKIKDYLIVSLNDLAIDIKANKVTLIEVKLRIKPLIKLCDSAEGVNNVLFDPKSNDELKMLSDHIKLMIKKLSEI